MSRNFERPTTLTLRLILFCLKLLLSSLKYRGSFLTGKTLYYSRRDSITLGRLFQYSLRGETLFLLREDSVSGETLYRDTGTTSRTESILGSQLRQNQMIMGLLQVKPRD